MTNHLKEEFLLDPTVIFLNHGSFGATPRVVFEAHQQWQMRLEQQPVLFLGREFDSLLQESRKQLSEYLHADTNDIVYIPNATHGVNIIARSLNLKQGDEVLACDHEYGACDYTWEFVCSKAGATYIHQPISIPVFSDDEIVEQFWSGVTKRTKVIYLSWITSPTALRLPIEKICARAKQAGILTIIDAAHAPGQIPVDLQMLDADVVFGNCHKWMMAPKSAGFLYVRRELQQTIDPLVVSWGYRATKITTTGSQYVDYLQWTGTNNPTAALTVPIAIKFMQDHNWDTVRHDCQTLLRDTVQRINSFTGLDPVYPADSHFYSQMGVARLPDHIEVPDIKAKLYDQFRVEVPIIDWNRYKFVRISIQGYNTQNDADVLVDALKKLL